MGRKFMKTNMYKSPSKEIVQALDAAVEIEDFLPPPCRTCEKGEERKNHNSARFCLCAIFQGRRKKERIKVPNAY